jgi:hypothetical protein
MTHHVVMFSGGVCSWAPRGGGHQFGRDDVTLLFADTLIEDEDLYLFLAYAEIDLMIGVTCIADGRTPWEVFRDERFLGNSRLDPCSKILKRLVCDRWLEAHCDPADTVIHLGLHWSESDRIDTTRSRFAERGWVMDAPLTWDPWIPRLQIDTMLADAGIPMPRLYCMGFSHNNCGGFCIKAGHAQFGTGLLKHPPERYAAHGRPNGSSAFSTAMCHPPRPPGARGAPLTLAESATGSGGRKLTSARMRAAAGASATRRHRGQEWMTRTTRAGRRCSPWPRSRRLRACSPSPCCSPPALTE